MTYYGNGKSDWPAAMLEQLKTCHAKGMMDSEMERLPCFAGKSRNSIIGARYRLGLKANKPTSRKAVRRSRMNPQQRRNKLPAAKVNLFDGWKSPRQMPSKPRTFEGGAGVAFPATERGELPVIFPPLPLVPIGFAELESASCRWPTHHTGAAMLYCGAAKDEAGSYCRFHAGIAFKPRAA